MPRARPSTEPVASAPDPTDDEALVRRVASGEAEAARTVVDAYLGKVHRFAFRMLGDSAEAEDVAQETFVRLWQQADGWRGRAKLQTWLLRVARNLCIDRLRARRVRADAAVPISERTHAHAYALLEERQRTELVTRAVAELPQRQREALALVYYEGLSNADAADVLEISVDALESLLARARRGVATRLGFVRGPESVR